MAIPRLVFLFSAALAIVACDGGSARIRNAANTVVPGDDGQIDDDKKEDEDGNTDDEEAIAPSVAITSPTANAFVGAASQAQFRVAGTCSGNGIKVALTTPVAQQAICQGNQWTATLDVSMAAEGTLTVSVEHASADGTKSALASRTFVKDTIAPGVTFDALGPVNLANRDAFLWSGTCTEEGQLLSLTGGLSESALCQSGLWEVLTDLSGSSDGAVSAVVELADAAGNAVTASTQVNKDTVPPTLAVGGSASVQRVTRANINNLVFSGTCSEDGGTISVSPGVSNDSPCAGGVWTVTLDLQGEPDGLFTLNFIVTDASGNAASAITREIRKEISVRFAVIGDYGYASNAAEEKVADMVKSWSPEFIVTVGDNNYNSGEAATIDANIGQYYADYISGYTGAYGAGSPTRRFFPAMGNHDWYTTNAQPYLDYFDLPGNERYYEFTWRYAHFFIIDSDGNEPDGTASNSVQGQWLQNALTTSTSPYNFVFMHHAPFSSGDHGSAAGMQWPYRTWGADAVFAGHDHDYERILTDRIPYFVNGLGGKSLYAFGTPVAGSAVRYNENYGAMLIEADSTSATFKFYSIGITEPVLIDSYSIAATPPAATALVPAITLISQGATWKYSDGGYDLGVTWQTASYNDTTWPTGPAQLGYGDTDEATVIGYGPSSAAKYITTYFRHTFPVTMTTGAVTLNLLRDDGAVIFLNGTEVVRSNMPAGPILSSTVASGAIGGGAESTFYAYDVPASALVIGDNVLAVEIHQSGGSSSDVSFDLSLILQP